MSKKTEDIFRHLFPENESGNNFDQVNAFIPPAPIARSVQFAPPNIIPTISFSHNNNSSNFASHISADSNSLSHKSLGSNQEDFELFRAVQMSLGFPDPLLENVTKNSDKKSQAEILDLKNKQSGNNSSEKKSDADRMSDDDTLSGEVSKSGTDSKSDKASKSNESSSANNPSSSSTPTNPDADVIVHELMIVEDDNFEAKLNAESMQSKMDELVAQNKAPFFAGTDDLAFSWEMNHYIFWQNADGEYLMSVPYYLCSTDLVTGTFKVQWKHKDIIIKPDKDGFEIISVETRKCIEVYEDFSDIVVDLPDMLAWEIAEFHAEELNNKQYKVIMYSELDIIPDSLTGTRPSLQDYYKNLLKEESQTNAHEHQNEKKEKKEKEDKHQKDQEIFSMQSLFLDLIRENNFALFQDILEKNRSINPLQLKFEHGNNLLHMVVLSARASFFKFLVARYPELLSKMNHFNVLPLQMLFENPKEALINEKLKMVDFLFANNTVEILVTSIFQYLDSVPETINTILLKERINFLYYSILKMSNRVEYSLNHYDNNISELEKHSQLLLQTINTRQRMLETDNRRLNDLEKNLSKLSEQFNNLWLRYKDTIAKEPKGTHNILQDHMMDVSEELVPPLIPFQIKNADRKSNEDVEMVDKGDTKTQADTLTFSKESKTSSETLSFAEQKKKVLAFIEKHKLSTRLAKDKDLEQAFSSDVGSTLNLSSLINQQHLNLLMLAALEGDVEMMSILLQVDNKLFFETNKFKKNVLHIVCEKGIGVSVNFLLQRDQSLKLLLSVCQDGMNALDYAARSGHLEVVQCLLHYDKEAQLLLLPKSSQSALFYAATEEHINIVDYFLKKFPFLLCELSSDGLHLLQVAANKGLLKMANALIDEYRILIPMSGQAGMTVAHSVGIPIDLKHNTSNEIMAAKHAILRNCLARDPGLTTRLDHHNINAFINKITNEGLAEVNFMSQLFKYLYRNVQLPNDSAPKLNEAEKMQTNLVAQTRGLVASLQALIRQYFMAKDRLKVVTLQIADYEHKIKILTEHLGKDQAEALLLNKPTSVAMSDIPQSDDPPLMTLSFAIQRKKHKMEGHNSEQVLSGQALEIALKKRRVNTNGISLNSST